MIHIQLPLIDKFHILTGYYCTGPGETQYDDKECPAGHFCLVGTTISTNFPCPGGSYLPTTGETSEAACIPCPEGNYCVQVCVAAILDINLYDR